jgi:PAS domain S-box-containing protein
MRYKLAELIDTEKTEKLLGSFREAIGVPSAVFDLEGNVIVKSRWLKICSDFHRSTKITCKRCIESNTSLANELMRGKPYSLYMCLNGLKHAAAPIVIEGEHVAIAVIGQFLTEEPDLEFFSRQADNYGFDKSAYMQALSEVPIVANDVRSFLLTFITSLTEMLASLGIKHLSHLEIQKELKNARDRLQIKNEELSASEEELRVQNEELISSRARIEDLARFPAENPNPVMRISASGMVLYANEAADCFLSHPGERRDAEAPPYLRDMIDKTLSTGSSAPFDTQVQDKIYSVTVSPVPGKDYVNIYAQDITDRKKMEEELLRAKQEWERTFDSVPDLIAIMDPSHRIVRANREMARRIGVTPEQCVGRRCYEAVHGSSCPPEFCPHGKTLNDGREHAAEMHEQRFGGDFLVTTTPLRDEQGDIVGTVHVARDITERKQIEEELRRSRDELEARVRERTSDLGRVVARLELINQELQEFAFVASHDLQEPLRKIQSFCDLIVRTNRDKVDEKGKDYLFRMQKAARRMQQLLRDLLSYSRVTTQLEPFRETNLRVVASEAADVFELKLREARAKLEIAELPVIEADSSQMSRLFQNLISNAVKYRGPDDTLIKIYGETCESACRIFVEDNGIGFDEKYLDRIFAPFQRLHGRSEYPGTGMGLAICRKIVERHGGSITARSAPGSGTTFIITLPVKQKNQG